MTTHSTSGHAGASQPFIERLTADRKSTLIAAIKAWVSHFVGLVPALAVVQAQVPSASPGLLGRKLSSEGQYWNRRFLNSPATLSRQDQNERCTYIVFRIGDSVGWDNLARF